MDALFFHPRVVHIPIALGVLMPLIAGVLLLAWFRGWLPARAFWLAAGLQGLLVLSGIVGLQTGEAEEHTVEKVVPEEHIEHHEAAAQVFVAGSTAVFALMLAAGVLNARPAGRPLAALGAAGTLVVLWLAWRTGEAGGALVYEHNAARAYTTGGADAPGYDEHEHAHDHEH